MKHAMFTALMCIHHLPNTRPQMIRVWNLLYIQSYIYIYIYIYI
jgi:hypothetical protein